MTSQSIADRPVDRPPAPPLETHRVGNTTYRLTPDGVERVRRATPLTPARSPKRPTLPKAPKVARRDRDQTLWARRVAAHITARKEKLDPVSLATCAAVVGRDMGAGFAIVATDGDRALCRRGAPTTPTPHGKRPLTLARVQATHGIAVTPDMELALRRMLACNSDRRTPQVQIAVDATQKRVVFSTQDVNDGTLARETVAATDATRSSSVCLNGVYLNAALGLDRLVLVLPKDETGLVAIDTADHDMRLLIMPIRGTVEQIKGAAPRITPTTARSSTRHPHPQAPTPATPHGAPSASTDGLTPGQKAWRTRQARIARGEASPTDWAAAGRKAWVTRQRHAAQAIGGGP